MLLLVPLLGLSLMWASSQLDILSIVWVDTVTIKLPPTQFSTCVPRAVVRTPGIEMGLSDSTTSALHITKALENRAVSSLEHPVAWVQQRERDSAVVQITARKSPAYRDTAAVHGLLLEIADAVEHDCAGNLDSK